MINLLKILSILLLFLAGCGGEVEPSVEVYYEPPFIPLVVSIDNQGNLSVRASGPELVTPIGVFGVEAAVTHTQYFEGVDKSLVVRVGDSACAYDLSGGDFQLEFEDDAYTIQSITATGPHLYLDLKGPSNTCSVDYRAVRNSKVYDSPATCEGASPSRLRIGDPAQVTNYQVKVFTGPGKNYGQTREAVLNVGRRVTIIDGPICGPLTPGQGLFWRISTEEITLSNGRRGTVVGWIAEESGDIYFLSPAR